MKKSKSIKILIIIVLMWLIIFSIDFIRAGNNQNPIFVLYAEGIQDGGSAEFYCLGYKIIKYASAENCDSGYKVKIINMKVGTYFMQFDKNNPF